MERRSIISRAGRRAGSARLLLAASVAMIPLAFATAGSGAAGDVPPATRFAVGSPAMATAQQIARAHWGVDACGGNVAVSWGVDDASINARSYWANPYSAYGHPHLNVHCRIVFNAEMAFTWPKFCTVLVHEYGHLVGRPHGPDGPDVMSPVYRAPLAACAIDEPGVPAAPAPAATPVVDAPAARTTTTRADRRSAARRARRTARAKRRARARQASAALRRFSSADHAH